MRNIILVFAILLFAACRKQDKENLISWPTVYPDAWGMVGTVSDSNFNVTSFNATLNYDTNVHLYELNVNGWNSITNETIYLRYSGASIQPGTYKLENVTAPLRQATWASYQKDNKDIMYGNGYVNIHSLIDSIVKGAYDFTTADKKHIKGVFTIKPYYVSE